ncbi:MAG: F0F1 ATP synthase subunit alpha, partial [Azoarcus sp.]|nr:F0F1 ATP synthase subunit alpha [Azoarcus sp.]
QYRELAAFAQFASDLDDATRKQLERGRRVTELMKQTQYSPMSIAEMGFVLYAVNNGHLDDIEANRVLAFEAGLLQYIKVQKPDLVTSVMEKRELDDDAEKTLADTIAEFKKSWV